MFYNRGVAYGNKGEYDRAIQDYNEAIRINPGYADAFNNRGNAYADKGEYDRAIQDYDEVIRINPEDAVAFIARGLAYWYKGEYDHSILDCDEAIRIDPSSTEAHFNKGLAYAGKGENILAIENFDNAVRLSPDYYARTYIDNNQIALFQRTVKIALDALGEFISGTDNYDTATKEYYKGVWWLFSNNQVRARRCFDKAKELGYEDAAKIDQHLGNLK